VAAVVCAPSVASALDKVRLSDPRFAHITRCADLGVVPEDVSLSVLVAQIDARLNQPPTATPTLPARIAATLTLETNPPLAAAVRVAGRRATKLRSALGEAPGSLVWAIFGLSFRRRIADPPAETP